MKIMKKIFISTLKFLFKVVGWFCFFIGTVNIANILIYLPESFTPLVNIWICFVSSIAMTIWWYSITTKPFSKEIK